MVEAFLKERIIAGKGPEKRENYLIKYNIQYLIRKIYNFIKSREDPS
jgi:hypothetical protein